MTGAVKVSAVNDRTADECRRVRIHSCQLSCCMRTFSSRPMPAYRQTRLVRP